MRSVLIIIYSFITIISFGQTDTIKFRKIQYSSISANYSYGNVVQTNDFVKGNNLKVKPI